MKKETLVSKYTDLKHLIHSEFDRNILKYGDKIKCRKGCSQCCSQIFRITGFDADIIKEHINTLPAEKKKTLKLKATEYISVISKVNSEIEKNINDEKLPCPALNEEGECLIYEARPVICRRFGPPVYDYKNPEKLFACELNFGDGEEICDDVLIPNQTIIGKKWDELKTEFNKENNLNEIASTTIAEAILNT